MSDYVMICDMFGVLLSGMPKYAVVLHQVAITFSIPMAQLYKVVRINYIQGDKEHARIIADEDEAYENKSENTVREFAMRNITKKSKSRLFMEKGPQIAGKSKTPFNRQTAVDRIKVKTIGVKHRLEEKYLHEDESIL